MNVQLQDAIKQARRADKIYFDLIDRRNRMLGRGMSDRFNTGEPQTLEEVRVHLEHRLGQVQVIARHIDNIIMGSNDIAQIDILMDGIENVRKRFL